ncbi:MAG: lysophospholipid acyltransferase family protein [Gammaproteobacteria bacterium]|nr:lysophospholipid acyltransferase family protein [Gammaproteobacteria bacterium]
MLLLRSLLFTCMQVVTTVLFSLLGVLLWPIPFKWRYKVVSKWARLNLWLLEKICGIRYQIEGLEHVSDEPSIIMCKHQSAWETLALQVIFPQQVWVLKRELLWIPFFGWGLAALNPIAIDRSAGRKALGQVVAQGKERLLAGSWVVIFPEGTRIPIGQIGRFGIGGAKLAVESNANVIPVAHDAGKAWPKKGFIKYPSTIKMVIGEKIAVKDKSATEVNKQVYQWMEGQMTNLEGGHPKIFVKEDKNSGKK